VRSVTAEDFTTEEIPMKINQNQRQGSIAVLLCLLLLPLLALLALFVDYGFLLYIRTDLQRAADQATLAAVRDLVPNDFGHQDLPKVRQTLRDYLEMNFDEDFVLLDSDIEIGRYDPDTIYSSVDLLPSGVFDTVRITIRRDDLANKSVSLFFARVFDKDNSDVTVQSTAILQRGRYLEPGTAILPMAIHESTWNNLAQGEIASIYGDGRIEDEFGDPIPGNWGTVDLGPQSNSTTELSIQIREGLSQNDLDSLNQQGAIPSTAFIDSQQNPLVLNGDTGLSSGLKHAIEDAHGTRKLVPVYESSTAKGGGLIFDIVGWGLVEVHDSAWNGSKNSRVEIRKAYNYDGHLRPNPDLSDIAHSIDGVFTSPVLAQ
jgi:hypothetical protein